MKKLEFITPRGQGDWTVNIVGFGWLAVINHSNMTIIDGVLHTVSNFDFANARDSADRRIEKKRDGWIEKFKNSDFVCVQRDKQNPDGSFSMGADGYIGVYEIRHKEDPESDGVGYMVEMVKRMTDGTPSKSKK